MTDRKTAKQDTAQNLDDEALDQAQGGALSYSNLKLSSPDGAQVRKPGIRTNGVRLNGVRLNGVRMPYEGEYETEKKT